MIERFTHTNPQSGTLYAVLTADNWIAVTDDRNVATIAHNAHATAPLLNLTAAIGRCRPYAHCLRRLVVGAYGATGYDALAKIHAGDCRVTRDQLVDAMAAIGDVKTRQMLGRRNNNLCAHRAFAALLKSLNDAATWVAAGNGISSAPVPWVAAIIAAGAARIVVGRQPRSVPHVRDFITCLNPLEESP
jgi:hypothetical protein